jgi:hypothetical protein
MSFAKRSLAVIGLQTASFDAIAQRRALDLQKRGGPGTVAVGLLQCPANQARFMNPKTFSE